MIKKNSPYYLFKRFWFQIYVEEQRKHFVFKDSFQMICLMELTPS